MISAMRPVALIGMPGAGKSAIAPLLAERLAGDADDLDARIEAEAGRPVARLFAEGGEAAFRALETRALEQAIDRGVRVIACGGGIVTVDASRALLRRCDVVWLEVTPAEAALRLGDDVAARPLLAGDDVTARFRFLLRGREEHYRALAVLRESTDGRTPDEIADTLARRLSAAVRKEAR